MARGVLGRKMPLLVWGGVKGSPCGMRGNGREEGLFYYVTGGGTPMGQRTVLLGYTRRVEGANGEGGVFIVVVVCGDASVGTRQ